MATIRFSRKPKFTLPQRKGLSGAHLLESLPMADMRQTTEQQIRGGDGTAEWVLLVCAYDVEGLKAAVANEPAAAFYRLSYSLSAKEAI
jgi:hypothetical protein